VPSGIFSLVDEVGRRLSVWNGTPVNVSDGIAADVVTFPTPGKIVPGKERTVSFPSRTKVYQILHQALPEPDVPLSAATRAS